jgi:hypothetical protein
MSHLLTKHTRYVQDDLQDGLNLFAVLFTHNNQQATVPFKARTHISLGTDDTTVRIVFLRSLISRIFLL